MAARDPTSASSFGGLLRRHRLAAGLSQEALAERADLSARAVGDLERGVKLRPHPETLRRLADALQLGPDDRAALAAAARPASSAHGIASPGALPRPLTPLIGRQREVATVVALLRRAEVRLLTLTGPGGVGKTRLGLHAVASLHGDFPDGIWFVDLAMLAEPELVPVAVAKALGIRDESHRPLVEVLAAFTSDKQMLLVLDNFEHLLDAAPFVAQLLASTANLKVLATSRARLRLRGEQELSVPPLALPDLTGINSAEILSQSEAVRLFIQRSAEAKPDFAVTDESVLAIAEICRRLDGLPLAIELAAARVKLLPPVALLHRLERRLPVLVSGARDLPARQRTLRDAIAWSHDLLSVEEQALFRCLAVFAGEFTLEAADAVCSGKPAGGRRGSENALFLPNPLPLALDSSVLEGLASLVEKSLLRQEEINGEMRCAMLETIREFALECLVASGEEAATRRRHAIWCLVLAEGADGKLWGPEPGRLFDQIEAQQGNIRAALAWALDQGEIECGLRLTAALWDFYIFRGHLSEARRWQEALLAVASAVPPAVLAIALSEAGELAQFGGDVRVAIGHQEDSLALARKVGTPLVLSRTLYQGALMAERLGDHDRQVALAEEALELFRNHGVSHWTIEVLLCLGRAARQRSDAKRARALLEEARSLARAQSDAWSTAWATTELAEVAAGEGDAKEAAALFREGVRLHADHGDHMGIDLCLIRTAKLAGAAAHYGAAVRLLAAADALRTRRGAGLAQADRLWQDAYLTELRARLGEDEFASADAAARGLILEEVIAEVMSISERLASADA